MKKKLTFFFCILFLFSAHCWGQTWNLSPTMTATLDGDGVLTISTTLDAEPMPDYTTTYTAPWDDIKNNIISAVIENNVTRIGMYAFYYCRNLTSVAIPNSVTSIGWHSFCMSGLTSLTIPNSVKTIEYGAFMYCPITSVTIPNSVVEIDDYAFYSCWLTSITIPNSVTTIGIQAFSGNFMTSILVDADNAVYSSEDGVLYNKNKTYLHTCPAGKSGTFTIPTSVTEIGSDAFWASNLNSITIPNSVVTIGEDAFGIGNKLTDFTVEWATPLSVPNNVFYNVNTSNVILHVPAGTIALYQADPVWGTFGTFDDGVTPVLSVLPTSLDFIASGEQKTFTITSNTGWTISSDASWVTVSPASGSNDGTITVTATENTGIQRTAIITVSGTDVTSKTISVTQEAAASALSVVYSYPLYFPWISEQKTFDITSITDWTVSSDASWITVSPASGSNNGTITVTAAENTTTDQRTATITVSGTGVTTKTLSVSQSAPIPNGGQTWQLTPTMTATLNNAGVLTISTTKTEGEAMPDYLQMGSPWFVAGMGYNILSVVIEDKVTAIGKSAFNFCMNLTSVTIPNSVISFGDFSFQMCPNLATIQIPNSVAAIGAYTFADSGLASVTIPQSVSTIGDVAFGFCHSLTDVTVEWQTPLAINNVSDGVFISTNVSAATLHVPAGTKARYQADPVWGTFGTIVEEAPNYTLSISSASLSFVASGEQQAFTITSNTDWTVSSSASWLTVSPASGSNNGTVTVTAVANSATTQRTATITVSGTSITAQTISITQDAAPVLNVSISPSTLNFAASGEQQILSITSNTNWRVSSDASWLTVSPTSGSNDGSVTATAAENTATTQRTATITISGIVSDADGDGILDAHDYTTITTISVTQDAAEIPSVIPDETQTVGTDGKGTIELNLSIPSGSTLTGSFEITFPAGMTLDEQLTVLSFELSGNFSLVFSYEGNNTWLITIQSNALRRSTATEYQNIMSIAYTVNDSLPKGIYDATIKNLDFLMDNGISIKEDLMTVPINVNRSGTSIENIGNTSFNAFFTDNTLSVESSNAEKITIYSVNGAPLYSTMKNAGTIEIPFSSIPGSVYIIKGNVSGTIKIVK